MSGLTLRQIIERIEQHPEISGLEGVFVTPPGGRAVSLDLDISLWRWDFRAVCLPPSKIIGSITVSELIKYLRDQIGELAYSYKGANTEVRADHYLMICRSSSVEALQVKGVLVREGKVHLAVADTSKTWK